MAPTRTLLAALLISCSLAGSFGCRESGPPRPNLPRLIETPRFALTNLDGRPVTEQSLRGKPWVVNFIFTRCGGPCPLMTRQMRALQKGLIEAGLIGDSPRVLLVSITVDPEHDTPEVLREFADLWEADTGSWLFLTGPPHETLQIVREGFKVTAEPAGPGDMHHGDILHSTSFLLVDPTGWVRRIVPLGEEGLVENLVRDLGFLLAESEA